ncbi:MAG: hypothetical protein ABIL02_00560 [candidate division WOR-3 bacterium]
MKGLILFTFCLGIAEAGFLNTPIPNFLSRPIISHPVEEGRKQGIDELRRDLSKFHWRYNYAPHVFDCSQMSFIAALTLRTMGWDNTYIAVNQNHAWVIVETSPGRFTPVEATTLTVRDWLPYDDIGSPEEMRAKYPDEFRLPPYPEPYLYCRK